MDIQCRIRSNNASELQHTIYLSFCINVLIGRLVSSEILCVLEGKVQRRQVMLRD